MADDKYEENKEENNDEQESPKKYSWSDKSRQERVQHKMLLLVFLAVLFLFTAFIYFKSDARNSKEESNRYESIEEENDEDIDYSKKSDEIADKYKNNNEKESDNEKENQSDKEASDADETEVISQDANEYEEEYLKKYSQDLINGLKDNSKIVMDMYFANDTKNKIWKKIATEEFIKDIKNNMSDEKEKIISYEIFASKKYNDDEIIIGVVVELESDVNYYNLIYKEKDNQVRLNDIVFMW